MPSTIIHVLPDDHIAHLLALADQLEMRRLVRNPAPNMSDLLRQLRDLPEEGDPNAA